MPDYNDHSEMLNLLKEDQEAEQDLREKVREVDHFLNKPDGQWEPDMWNKMSGKPRYTFDQCNDIVDDIAGEMDRADFGIKVNPAGGDATDDIAATYDGLIRNIQNMSNAKDIYNSAGRDMSAAGLSGWRVIQKWVSVDSFEQDLLITPISNFVDRVWFDASSELKTREDAGHCWVLSTVSIADYKRDYPDGSGTSVSDDRATEVYFQKAEQITIGEMIWKEPIEKELVLMSDGSVYADDEKFQAVKDELLEVGIVEEKRRKKESYKVMTRLFDGGGWLKEAEETVFTYLPIIPTYGNFKVSESKVIYWGAITKKMDAQRVYNYSESRKVEETALAPREKMVMTREQAANDTATIATMNTNSDPVQLYTHVDNQPPPFKIGGSNINPGLETVSNGALTNLRSGIGQQPNQPIGLRSGVAVELEQDKSDTKNVKYFKAQEVAICHTAKVLINAIPKVYDTRRQVRLIGEDGTTSMTVLHDRVFDQQQQKLIELNDVSQGQYDVVCEMGPAFQNKQKQTTAAFADIAQIDPTIVERGKDIWLKNISAPGMDAMADRARIDLFNQGLIPESQMTDEEKEKLAQQQALAA
ncbi:MAG: portal protein, partial [Candidatus Thorarchaeota archaeon]